MIKRGHFIVVEGLEGAGKSTALQTLNHYLQTVAPEVVLVREPGGTRVGEVIRTILKENSPEEALDPRAELLLFYAARVQLLEQIIYPALERGAWVLADRFEWSTFAYQGAGRKLDQSTIANLSQFCLNGFKPDLIVFLDIHPQVGLERARQRSEADRIEQESLDFFMDVYQSYHQLLQASDEAVCIDALQPLDTVQAAILAALKTFVAQHANR